MITTEERAREKWCPFVRIMEMKVDRLGGNLSVAAVNRSSSPHITKDNTSCIASHCMMWQWSPLLTDEKPVGYCGLSIGRAEA
jgi:hypothetical protein